MSIRLEFPLTCVTNPSTLFALFAIAVGSAASAQQGPPASPVRVDTVRLDQVEQRRMITGDLRAVRRSTIAGEEPGLVLDMPLDIGAQVKRGDLIARLDSRRLEIMLSQNEADLDAARAARDEAQVTLTWRSDDYDLLVRTSEEAAASPKELLDTRAALDQAKARLLRTERDLTIIERQGELLRQRLDDMEIRAPFDGVVLAKHAEQGEWLGVGDPVVEILSTGDVEAWLNVPQQHFPALSGGRVDVAIRIDATGDFLDPSEVRILPQVDARARTFTLIARLANADGALAPGMSIGAFVPTGVRGEQLTILRDAILRSDAGAFVYVVREGQAMPARVRVTFPVANGRVVVESDEIGPDDIVVTEGNERLFPGSPVAPITDDAAVEH